MSEGSSFERTCAGLAHDGYVILPDVLSRAEVTELRDALDGVLPGSRFGRKAFEGERTERVYSLLAKCPEVAALAEHPRVLALGDRFVDPGFLISSVQAVKIHSGERAQALHCDDESGAPGRPRGPQGFSTMWALTDFTVAIGATRLIPGSHGWDTDATPDAADAIAAEMTAGSVLVYLGGVYHGGGAHTAGEARLGISIIYCQPWLRQFENQTLAVPPKIAAGYSNRVQRMLGYSTWGPTGNVDGMDPIRLLDQA